jgi:hypothetical protein
MIAKTTRFALIAVLALAATQATAAVKPPKKFVGTITAVNATSDPRTVTLTDEDRSVTVKVSDSTSIIADTAPGTFADVRLGLDATARYDRNTLTARTLVLGADPNKVRATGNVVLADPVSGQITIDTNNDGVIDATLFTDVQTELMISDVALAPAQIGQLTGIPARVEYNSTSMLAYRVNGQPTSAFVVNGTVTAVDTSGMTLTATINGVETNFVVAQGAGIHLNDNARDTSLGGVLVGDQARIVYAENGIHNFIATDVTVLNLTLETVSGLLKGVTSTTVTVGADGDAVVLTYDEFTEVTVNGQPSSAVRLNRELLRGQRVRVRAEYVSRGGGNLATKINATIRRRR